MAEPKKSQKITENVRTDKCSGVREVLSGHYYSIRVQQNNRYTVSESWQSQNNFSLHAWDKNKHWWKQAGHFKDVWSVHVECVNSHKVPYHYGSSSVLDTLLENEKKKCVCLWGHATHTLFCCFYRLLLQCSFCFFAFYGASYVQICLAMHNFLFSLFFLAMRNFFVCENILAWTSLEPEPSQTSSFADRPLTDCAEVTTWQMSYILRSWTRDLQFYNTTMYMLPYTTPNAKPLHNTKFAPIGFYSSNNYYGLSL